jgi:hypothetical protein
VTYCAGENNKVADALSRIPSKALGSEDMTERDGGYTIQMLMKSMDVVITPEVREESEKGETLQKVKKFVLQGWPCWYNYDAAQILQCSR